MAVAVFSVVVGVSRGFSVPHSSISSLNADGASHLQHRGSGRGAVRGGGTAAPPVRCEPPVLSHHHCRGSRHSRDAPLGGTGFGSQFITVAYNCFVLVIWCLLAYVAYSSRLSRYWCSAWAAGPRL